MKGSLSLYGMVASPWKRPWAIGNFSKLPETGKYTPLEQIPSEKDSSRWNLTRRMGRIDGAAKKDYWKDNRRRPLRHVPAEGPRENPAFQFLCILQVFPETGKYTPLEQIPSEKDSSRWNLTRRMGRIDLKESAKKDYWKDNRRRPLRHVPAEGPRENPAFQWLGCSQRPGNTLH
jgi:hypothetical protein